MREFIDIQNKYTLSLEEEHMSVSRGWTERLAHKAVWHDRTAKKTTSGSFRADVEALLLWHKHVQPTVYSVSKGIGRRASLVALAYFIPPESMATKEPDYQFSPMLYDEQFARNGLTAFVKAAHYDFASYGRYEGDLWLEIKPSDERDPYEEVGYEVLEESGELVIMKRKGEGLGDENTRI